MVNVVYLWDQIRVILCLGFVQFDPETNVCDEIIKTFKIELYYYANCPIADYTV
jgi:hypothetical protein